MLELQLSQKEVMREREAPERLLVELRALVVVPQASAEQVSLA
ncbi:hypothetical protein YTPLAS72_06650 [Nitrospira sp.]|nr:hypothetical protein YTPLAS72_06650 [Nitrospira sp.]